MITQENSKTVIRYTAYRLIGLVGRVFTNGPGDLAQSLVASYQRLSKGYLIPPFLTLSNIRYISRVKWSNPGKGVAPSPTPRCSSYWKGSLLVTLNYGRQLYLLYIYIYIYIYKWVCVCVCMRFFNPASGEAHHWPNFEFILLTSLPPWKQHSMKQQLYGHLPPIPKIIQVRSTRHAGHCQRSRYVIISDVLLWTLSHGCASVGWPTRTYIQQFCEDIGCTLEDILGATDDRDKWRERVRKICVNLMMIYIYIYILAVPGHALLWLSLFKWEKKKKMHVSHMFNFPILVDTQYSW